VQGQVNESPEVGGIAQRVVGEKSITRIDPDLGEQTAQAGVNAWLR
jgi:hypothetical protein